MLAHKLLASSGGAEEKLYVDDVFSTYLTTGNTTVQTINTGLDMSGKGGMLLFKSRGGSGLSHIYDTNRSTLALRTYSSNAQANEPSIVSSYTSTGITGYVGYATGSSGCLYSFRKAPKFFDFVIYTGDGASTRSLSHSLGSDVGFALIKCTSGVSDWTVVVRRSNGNRDIWPGNASGTGYGLNTNYAASSQNYSGFNAGFTSSVIKVGSSEITGSINVSGASYVAYLFAHDPSPEGMIQCGSFTTDASGNATVNHGWSAGVQFAGIKASSTTGDWEMYDTSRTSGWSGDDARLCANLSNAEDSVTRLSASGTSISFTGLSASSTYVYVFVVAPT